MVDYELLARNRPAGHALRGRIVHQLRRGRSPYDGRLPGAIELGTLMDEWLPNGRVQAGTPNQGRTWEDLTRHRKTSDYWRDHCQTVGGMMQRLAVVVGQDELLWHTAGLVHDLDFLAGPHFEEATAPGKAHPTAIATEVLEMGLPPVLVLAVLEHSPHLQMPPSSPLSHALILCDEHATMTGAGQKPDYGADAPAEIIACLSGGKPIAGFTRDDMQDRARRALAPLAAFYSIQKRGCVAAAFSSEGWSL